MDSLYKLRVFVLNFVKTVRPGDIYLLSGGLGSGKTTFVRLIGEVLGAKGVSSPTFALHNFYLAPDFGIHHFDLYRLDSEVELDSVGLWEILEDSSSVIFIEWPERAGSAAWPKNRKIMQVEFYRDQLPKIRVTDGL